MKKLYFAHPINTYGTPLEQRCLALISSVFPNHAIVNPSDQIHKDKVAELRKNDPKVNVMPYFKQTVAMCDELVALPFGDGMWGADVYEEAEVIEAKGEPFCRTWGIDPSRLTLYSVDQLDEEKKLSIDETRARIRNPDGTTKPYA